MKIFLSFTFVLLSVLGMGQGPYYTPPVKIPMLLSGSFAELRTAHFHSGIDIKTYGKINEMVYAAAEGNISRISVSPTGYGNALYIDHDNGTTSVYGHLNQFRPDIQEYIRQIQYERKAFQVDIQVLPGVFPVRKNDRIALSGNSGSSAGPHLHFELRNTKTGDPINPLKFGFFVNDTIPPKIYALQITPLSESSHVNYTANKVIYEVEFGNGKYRLKNNPVIPVFDKIGFAIEALDFLNGSANKLGIVSMELTIDDVILSSFVINRFSFSEAQNINSFTDYEEFVKSGRRFQRTWIEPCNQLANFEFSEKNGIFDPVIGSKHRVKIEIQDSHRNISVLEFLIEGKYREMKPVAKESVAYFQCAQSSQYNTGDFTIDLPRGALYSDLKFQYNAKNENGRYYSSIHQVHNKTVPLHKPATIGIKTTGLDEKLQQKTFLAAIDSETGKTTFAGGEYKDGWMIAEINKFGTYAVQVDTVPPTILPLDITNKTTLVKPDRISFEIKDDLAGIQDYEGLIDGLWALFEYDAKNNLITHYFDESRFEFNKQHQFKLTVTDKRGNSSVYEATFRK